MKISIFPLAPNLPRNKEEKVEAARKMIQPEVVEIETSDDLIRIVQDYVWSPYIFNGTRKKDNFKSSDWAVLDIDSGMTLDEAGEIISEANFTCLAMPTTSHTEEHHRFRLIFPLSRTVTNKESMIATMEDLYSNFPCSDRSTITDLGRAFFSSTDKDGFWIEGDLLEPVEPPKKAKNGSRRDFDLSARVTTPEDLKELITDLYGEERETIHDAIEYFLSNAHTGLDGEWVVSLNRCVFVLALEGFDLETIEDLIAYVAPEPLDNRDMTTIKKAYEDGVRAAEEGE